MNGIAGLGSPFATTPAYEGYYGFGSLATRISMNAAPPTSMGGGYPTTDEASSLLYYGMYLEGNPFGTSFSRFGDAFSIYGTPRLDLGGPGTESGSIACYVFGLPLFKADYFSQVYFLGVVDQYSGTNECGFYASLFSGEFSINAGSNPSNPPIYYNNGALKFNVGSIQIGESDCFNFNAVAGAPVKNLIIIDNTGTRLAIPLYILPR